MRTGSSGRTEELGLGTITVSPTDRGFCSPRSAFHFKGLALRGSHVCLDDKLIKLDFLDEMGTKELQLPKAWKSLRPFWFWLEQQKDVWEPSSSPLRLGDRAESRRLVKEKGLIKTHFSCDQVLGEPFWQRKLLFSRCSPSLMSKVPT